MCQGASNPFANVFSMTNSSLRRYRGPVREEAFIQHLLEGRSWTGINSAEPVTQT
jgi:hypothetical protein